VGEGPLEGALRARAAGLPVRFHGAQPPARVAELMREADVFVLPSRFENLPVVLLEAMACGLPVVATRVGGVPEIVDSSAGVLVPPGDVAALGSAISDVAGRLSDFDRAALAARAHSRYGIEAVGAVWDSIYSGLVSGTKGSR
jgi:glycosyltransferase involved in cell wall biosynthesis